MTATPGPSEIAAAWRELEGHPAYPRLRAYAEQRAAERKADSMTPERRAEIKARIEAATRPRLIYGHKSWAGENAVLTEEGHPVAVFGHGDQAAADAAFFAHAREDVPALLAAVEVAERKCGHHNEVANTALKAWEAIKAERDEILRVVSAWCVEYNNVGGVDAGDLAWRLEAAGYPLPPED